MTHGHAFIIVHTLMFSSPGRMSSIEKTVGEEFGVGDMYALVLVQLHKLGRNLFFFLYVYCFVVGGDDGGGVWLRRAVTSSPRLYILPASNSHYRLF